MTKQIMLSTITNLNLQNAALNLFADGTTDPIVTQVAPKNAEQAIESAPDYFKVNNVALSILAIEIKKAAIVSLHGIATELRCDCEDSLLGLRIIYALSSNYSLTFYFQPLLFCPVSETVTGAGGRVYRRYELCTEGNFYTYAPESLNFQLVTDIANKDAEVLRYQTPVTGLKVLDTGTTPFSWRNFIDANTISGDVKSLIFSFDQIEEVYNRTGIDGKIRFWNAVGNLETKNYGVLTKHLLLLSSDDVTYSGNNVIPSLRGFADLSHLCPPSCNGRNFFFILKP